MSALTHLACVGARTAVITRWIARDIEVQEQFIKSNLASPGRRGVGRGGLPPWEGAFHSHMHVMGRMHACMHVMEAETNAGDNAIDSIRSMHAGDHVLVLFMG
jgi:hypothetical protein